MKAAPLRRFGLAAVVIITSACLATDARSQSAADGACPLNEASARETRLAESIDVYKRTPSVESFQAILRALPAVRPATANDPPRYLLKDGARWTQADVCIWVHKLTGVAPQEGAGCPEDAGSEEKFSTQGDAKLVRFQFVKTFTVYFGFNKCNITAEADAVISDAREEIDRLNPGVVRLNGHADLFHSAAYSLKLSECRAQAVKANLVAKGIPESAIDPKAWGEMCPDVKTKDGVKEPRNRRVTIDLN